jgi:hypothetical protein
MSVNDFREAANWARDIYIKIRPAGYIRLTYLCLVIAGGIVLIPWWYPLIGSISGGNSLSNPQVDIFSFLACTLFVVAAIFFFFLEKWRPSSFIKDAFPASLTSLNTLLDGTGLRKHIQEKTQPYYGWDQHDKIHPRPSDSIFSEKALQNELSKTTGKPIILAGDGGAGKTRLAIELALAVKSDFEVRVIADLNDENDLNVALAIAQTHRKRLLLIVDYTEEMNNDFEFDKLWGWVDNNKGESKLLVTMRRSLINVKKNLKQRKLNNDKCIILDLTSSEQWLDGWRKKTCQTILGLETQRDLSLMGEDTNQLRNPAIATLLRFSARRNNSDDARFTIDNDDWLTRRLVQKIQPPIAIDDHSVLVELLCFFPMNANVRTEMSKDITTKKIIENLEKEGWVSKSGSQRTDNERWELGHDLLCDIPLQSFILSRKNQFYDHLCNFLEKAKRIGCEHILMRSIMRAIPKILENHAERRIIRLYGYTIQSIVEKMEVFQEADFDDKIIAEMSKYSDGNKREWVQQYLIQNPKPSTLENERLVRSVTSSISLASPIGRAITTESTLAEIPSISRVQKILLLSVFEEESVRFLEHSRDDPKGIFAALSSILRVSDD